eukprot:285629-Pelagomonas_calceolata.AAC.3
MPTKEGRARMHTHTMRAGGPEKLNVSASLPQGRPERPVSCRMPVPFYPIQHTVKGGRHTVFNGMCASELPLLAHLRVAA